MNESQRKLFKWGLKTGVLTGDTAESVWDNMQKETRDFAEAEIISRVFAVKALRALNPELKLNQKFLYSPYDIDFVSGDTLCKVEHKGRDFEFGKYNDYMISKKKADNNKGIWYLNTFTDGTFLMWDLDTAHITEKENTHNKETVHPEKGKITKTEYFLTPDDVIFRGKFNVK